MTDEAKSEQAGTAQMSRADFVASVATTIHAFGDRAAATGADPKWVGLRVAASILKRISDGELPADAAGLEPELIEKFPDLWTHTPPPAPDKPTDAHKPE